MLRALSAICIMPCLLGCSSMNAHTFAKRVTEGQESYAISTETLPVILRRGTSFDDVSVILGEPLYTFSTVGGTAYLYSYGKYKDGRTPVVVALINGERKVEKYMLVNADWFYAFQGRVE